MNIYLTHWLLKTADNTNLTEINPQSLYKYSENYSHNITSKKGVLQMTDKCRIWIFLILLILFYYIPANSKPQDTVPPTYWESYMSFKIGNYFEYEYNNILRYSKKIVGDTIVQSIGCHYYKIEYRYPINNNPAIWFERIDSIGDWYTYLASTQQQCRIYQLTIPLHSSFLNCSALFYISLEDTFSLSSILGDYGPFYVRKYYQGSLAPKDDYIARKFQLYYSYSYEVNNHTNLVGAIIDSIVYGSITGIKKEASLIPSEYKLFQNYPNPFNPKTLIKFSIPEYSYIKILVSDLMGREVLTLYKDYINPGENQIEFDGSDLASGVYFCQLQTENIVKTIKMILIK